MIRAAAGPSLTVTARARPGARWLAACPAAAAARPRRRMDRGTRTVTHRDLTLARPATEPEPRSSSAGTMMIN